MVNEIPKVPIGDYENTPSFPSEETSLDSGLPSHLPRKMYHARPVLHTVFLTTQLELLKKKNGNSHPGFGHAFG